MKFLVVVALLAAICAVAKSDYCYTSVVKGCKPGSVFGADICNAQYGNITNIKKETETYINSQLTKSYEYLLLATYFNSYKKNRPGFQKLYQGLSDRSFDDTIDMIKQLTRRGGEVKFNVLHENFKRMPTVEVDEVQSLALALDSEKELAVGAFHVHNHAHRSHDPEMAHYIEEKFLGKQAETIRKLSGYANDLSKMMVHTDSSSLALHLFDEYLHKQ